MILVDSNVLIDVLTEDPVWERWSAEQLARLGNTRQLAINPLIFAEVAVPYLDEAQLNAALPPGLVRLPLPYTAAFLAGSAFLEYRRRGGARRSPLPDFYSAPMPPRRGTRFSLGTLPGIAPTSPMSR